MLTFVAIIVNCLPTFAIFIRGRVVAHRTGYAYGGSKGNGYAKQDSSSNAPRSAAQIRSSSVPLEDIPSTDKAGQAYRQRAQAGEHWTQVSANKTADGRRGIAPGVSRGEPDNESQESIIGMEWKDGVYVTRTVDVHEN
jgi:hypothetical protein